MNQNIDKVYILPAHKCDIGSIDSGGIALRIHFLNPRNEDKEPQRLNSIFSLSEELALNIANAIEKLLKKS